MFIEESGSNQSLALFYFYDTFFRCGFNLFVDILNGNRISTLSAFRLVILLQCRKAKLNMEVSLR